ncbi:hypothetical protein FHG87_001365 [Trinorchestia longiramus]|nr:hypothetical protein FHG87_001365 [Trinorchestia longiramus]
MGSEGRPCRPKIELVRVSSCERSKIPVCPVQLRLEYCHFRSASYVNPQFELPTFTSRPLLLTPSPLPRWLPVPFHPAWRRLTHTGVWGRSKSCSQLLKGELIRPSASRSEGCLLALLVSRRSSNSPHSLYSTTTLHTTASARDVRYSHILSITRPCRSLANMSTITPPRTDHKTKASTLPQTARPPTRKPRGLKAFWRRLSQSPKPEDRAKSSADPAKFRSTVSAQSLEAVLHSPRGGDGSRSPSTRKTPRATPEKRKSSFGAFFSAFTQCKSGGDSVKRRKTSKTSSANGSGALVTTPGSHGNGELRPDYKLDDIPATIVPTITSQDIKSISSSPRVTARATSTRTGARPHSSACITSSTLGSSVAEGTGTPLPSERPESLHVLGSAPEQQLLVTARSSAVPGVMPAHVSSEEASAPHHRHQLTESSIDSIGACSIDVHPATSPTALSTRSNSVNPLGRRRRRQLAAGVGLTLHLSSLGL